MDLILPNRSLLIVDKGWLKEKSPSDSVSVSSQPKHRTNGRKAVSDDIAITVMGKSLSGTANSRKSPQANEESRKRNSPSRSTQELRFVNATTPAHNRDPEVRKLVRSHVRRGAGRDEKVRREQKKETDAASVESMGTQDSLDLISREMPKFAQPTQAFSGSSTPLYGGIGFEMNPRFYKLMNCYLEHIAHVLYPRESLLIFNPVKADWFPLALKDEVMLHTTLLAAAMHISILSGLRTSREPDLLTERVLRQLNQRISNRSDLSDATLGAIACLAMIENMQGHYDKWEMHMKGLANIVQIRGGLPAIDQSLQMKLCRADIEGSVDSLSEPQLNPPPRTFPSIYSTMPVGEPGPQSNDLLAMLIASGVDSRLVATFHDISRFSYALQHALSSTGVLLHPRSFDEDVVIVQYELLGSQPNNKAELEKALRLAALIYMKSVSRSTPISPWSSANLTRKLRCILDNLADDVPARLLRVWMCFVGGTASQGHNRTWFREQLVNSLALEARTWTWEDARAAMQRVLWVEQIHNDDCKRLWDEI